MQQQPELKLGDRLLHDDEEITPSELAKVLEVRHETILRWLKHPTLPLPHRREGFLPGTYKYFIKVSDIKDYFKLRKGLDE